MNFNNCHNINSFRQLVKQKLPSPILIIDGAADDEVHTQETQNLLRN